MKLPGSPRRPTRLSGFKLTRANESTSPPLWKRVLPTRFQAPFLGLGMGLE